MKSMAFITVVFIYLLYMTSGQGYFDSLTSKAELEAFAAAVQMKPLSRGEDMDRRQQEVQLKLMTYNIHRGIGKDGRLNLEAIAQVMKSSNAAVIGLQEVERYSIRTGFQDQIKKLSTMMDMNYAFGKSINVLNGAYGNALLSVYPIEEYKVFDLPSYHEQRTVLRTVINIDGLRLAIYNTHLGLNEAERSEQLDFILKMTSSEELEYILMGDMNSKAEQLDVLRENMKDSSEGSGKQLQNTYEDKGVQERIDYIFVSPNAHTTAYDIIKSDASDHYPVVSEVMIRGRE